MKDTIIAMFHIFGQWLRRGRNYYSRTNIRVRR